MNNISIFAKVCERMGMDITKPAPIVSDRGAKIIRHYQRWYDKSSQSAYDLDFAITRCMNDLAGANGGDPAWGEQRTEIRL